LEQPLFNKDGKRIFKIGYARDSLYKRNRDYKTAYGVITFTIHVIWTVPEQVVHKRANFALLTESIIHISLLQECATVDKNYEQNGKLFYDIETIVATIKNIQEGYKDDGIDTDEWDVYFNPNYKILQREKRQGQ
jgi:hypothetical protein